jgi:hypothetical protein
MEHIPVLKEGYQGYSLVGCSAFEGLGAGEAPSAVTKVPKVGLAAPVVGVPDSPPPESCQAGMLGRLRFNIEPGVEGDSGRLVTRRAFNDLIS